MNELLNKYKELIKNHKELCFKTPIINKRFNLCIVSNDGPIHLNLDESLYKDFDLDVQYDIDFYNKAYEANMNLLNRSFDNVSYFVTNGQILYKYYGNEENVIIPNGIQYIKRDAICNNKYVKYINANEIVSLDKFAIHDLDNLERIDLFRANSLSKINNVPNLKLINVNDKFSGIFMDNDFNKGLSINVLSNDRVFWYSYDEELDNLFFKETEAKRLNNSNIETIRITNNNRRFKATNYSDRFKVTSNIPEITKYIESLDDYIKDMLFSNNLIIYVISNYEHDGAYIPNKNILIADSMNMKRSFYHELGHAIDYNIGRVSQNEYFKKVFIEEKEKIYSTMPNKLKIIHAPVELMNHFQSNEEEFFAECFKRYYLKEKGFETECPLAYAYIDGIMKDLKETHDSQKSMR